MLTVVLSPYIILHTWLSALEIMGHGSNCVSKFDSVADLKAKIEVDKSNGLVPMAIVGTAGSVNMGMYVCIYMYVCTYIRKCSCM